MGELNKQGNWVVRENFCMRERYVYDLHCCCGPNWYMYPTIQDASYFGIWFNTKDKVIITFAEGDETTVFCQDDFHFNKELFAMDRFYERCN